MGKLHKKQNREKEKNEKKRSNYTPQKFQVVIVMVVWFYIFSIAGATYFVYLLQNKVIEEKL